MQHEENAAKLEEARALAVHVGEKLIAHYESIRARGELTPADKRDLHSLEKIVQRLRAPGGKRSHV